MKTFRKILCSIVSCFFTMLTVYAQQIEIEGKVTDGVMPLYGVSILNKRTTQGTTTDSSGKFKIRASIGATLLISYVGFRPKEVQIVNQSLLVIQLKPNVLEEVVVVGFGTQSKRRLTDNIVTIQGKQLQEIPTPSVFNSLTSKATGVQIRRMNGKVEGGLNVRIRGQSSLGAGNQPLYVIDGMPLINDNESTNGSPLNPLLTLNQNEIESIDILKDASSAAIYGARGANGVVLISTKKGKSGAMQYDLNFSSGISSPSHTRKWLNAKEYVTLFLEAGRNSSWSSEAFVKNRFDRYANHTDWENGAVDTDWQGMALQRGNTRNFDFSAKGGTKHTQYFFSTNFNNTQGIVVGNAMERLGGRLRVNHKVKNKFALGASLSYSRVGIYRVANDGSFLTPLQAVAQAPISPAFDASGEPFRNTVYANFLLEKKYARNKTTIRRIIANVIGTYELGNGLAFNSNFGLDTYAQATDAFRGKKTPFMATNGRAYASSVTTESYNWANYLEFKKHDDIHSFTGVLGMEYNEKNRRFISVTGIEFPEEGFHNVSSAAKITKGDGTIRKNSFLSYFTRLNYSYKNKLLVKASFRRDGASRFGKQHRFGNFASLSAGWVLSEESFFNFWKELSFLKVRGSYGLLGNANIGDFRFLNLYTANSYNKLPGIESSQAGNKHLKWESSRQLDIGLEFGLFENDLSGSIVYYDKRTDGLLFAKALPYSSGESQIYENIGGLKSSGLEFELTGKLLDSKDWYWSISANAAQNKNQITSLPNDNADQIKGQNILRVNQPVNSFYLIEYAGVDPANGDALYYTNNLINGKRSKAVTNDVSKAQRVVTGNPNPLWIGGLTSNVRYKNVDLSCTIGGEWGAKIYNGGGRYQSANADWFDNQTHDQLNRWQKPGDQTKVPQPRLGDANGTANSTRWLESGDFIRLRNVIVGYNFSRRFTQKIHLSKLRLYMSALNLWTLTNYSGYDPEARYDGSLQSRGTAFYSAPAPTTIAFGVQVKF